VTERSSQTIPAANASPLSPEATSQLSALFAVLGELKQIKRTGWLDRGLPPAETETVAEHSLLTALIGWISASTIPGLDADKVLKLALVHDLTEAIFGDSPPYDREDVPLDDPEALRAFFSVRHLRTPENAAAKRAAEEEAAREMLALMPDPIRSEIAALWQEYDEQATAEARYVKQVDRLEAFLQARAYAPTHPDVPAWGFTDMAMKEVDHPLLAALRDNALADDDDSPE